MPELFQYEKPFTLESGQTLPRLHLAYDTWGTLNEAGDNAVWVFHALTANSRVDEWWPGLSGEGKLFNPDKYFVICVNMPGSCYGSIGPLDENPETGKPYFHDFPFFTTRDMIRAYSLLKDALGIPKIHIGIGGSMGGQQLVEWAVEEPECFDYIIPLATNAQHSPWAIAFNASQRLAIENDSSWSDKNEQAGLQGMKTARAIALLSYRNYQTYALAQTEEQNDKVDHFKSESYQRYQGEKLAKRFNAFSYYFLSKSMDAHNIGRQRGGVIAALKKIKAKTLVISIRTDILFPPAEQEFLAKHIPGAEYREIHSDFGHDGFLLEFADIENHIRAFINPVKNTINEQQLT